MKDDMKWNACCLLAASVLSAGLWTARTRKASRARDESAEASPTQERTKMFAMSAAYFQERAHRTRRLAISFAVFAVAALAGHLAMDRFLAESANPALPAMIAATGLLAPLCLLVAAVTAGVSLRYFSSVSETVEMGLREKEAARRGVWRPGDVM